MIRTYRILSLTILLIAASILPGCIVTGQFGYTDPATGAFVGGTIGQSFNDGKTLAPLRGLKK